MSGSHAAPDCETVMARLFDYLDGELDAIVQAEIDRHLTFCRDCFSRAEFERRLSAKLVETAVAPAPATLRARVRTLLERF